MTTALARLIDILGGDPFTGFPYQSYQADRQGWVDPRSILMTVVRRMHPTLVAEIGSWKGDSAIAVARELDALAAPGSVLCVDTWLGGVEHILGDGDNGNWLRREHGFPQIYRQFLANVMHAGMQGRIIPVPQTSTIAARLLAHLGVRPQVIFLDASHDFIDLSIDLSLYWPLLAEGGVIVGDGYTKFWPGVIAAARRFARQQNLPLVAHRGQFVFAKGANPVAELCAPAEQTCWDPETEVEVPIPAEAVAAPA